jgi:hypothetical protein
MAGVTSSAGSVAFNALVSKEIRPSCDRPQHRWLPGIAECTLVTKSTHAIRKPSSAARSQHVPSWQGNEIPTIQSGNIQAQQKAQHQTAFSSDIERYCQNNSQPQVTSVSLLSTSCDLVYSRPVGAAGFEPATSSLSGMRSDQLSYAPSTAYFTVRAAWASSGVIADSSPILGGLTRT